VMAIFSSPKNGLLGTVELQRSVDRFGHETQWGGLQMGIGMHYGDVCVGCVGDADRLTTTVISQVVNLASRFEGLSKYYSSRILVSAKLLKYSAVTDLQARCLGNVRVKGSDETFQLYDVFEADSPRARAIKQDTHTAFQGALYHYARRNWQEATRLWKSCVTFAKDQAALDRGGRARYVDRAVPTKLFFCRRYNEKGVPYPSWEGDDCWEHK